MSTGMKRSLLLFPVVLPALLSACVSKSDYDALKAQHDQLQAQNQQLQQQAAADRQQIDRLRGAIKYTVNSDLLFPSGGWQLSADRSEAPAGGHHVERDPVAEACRERDAVPDLERPEPEPCLGARVRRGGPDRLER